MYRKHPKGKEYKIDQMEDISVNLPPKGWVYDRLTKEWVETGVYRRSPKPNECFWEVPPKPENYEEKLKKEKFRRKQDPKYNDPELQSYRSQSWSRRLNGFWFYNNTTPTYITGLHYFYMAFWTIDIGHPEYREMDKEFFYALQYSIEDPDCAGLIEVTNRRSGKTSRGGCFIYEMISRTPKARGGIQSKTREDAKEVVFKNAVVMPWTRLPDFFRPVFDTGGGSMPNQELSFFPRSVKGARATEELEESLESVIDFRSSEPIAYDGTKLKAYFADEAGKSKDVSVYERHSVLEFCFMVGTQYIGTALISTTVEAMEEGGEEFKKLWDDSDPRERDANGRTRSGLYRYFQPAFKNGNSVDKTLDKYGFPKVEKMKDFHLKRRQELKAHDVRRYLSYCRKQPFTAEEAFYLEADKCMFNAMLLNRQLEVVESRMQDDLYYRGDFLWEDKNKDTKVIFAPSQNGKFLVSKRIDPEKGSWNLSMGAGYRYPTNAARFVASCDPFDHSSIVDKSRGSKGAAYVYAKYSSVEEVSEEFVVEYVDRPDSFNEFAENVVKMCHFFGCKILIENNRPGLINYFKDRGYSAYVIIPQGKNTPGIAGSAKAHSEIVEHIEDYVNEKIDRVVFPELLKDWLKFDISNTTKYDRTMASGYGLIAAGRPQIRVQPTEEKKLNLRKIFY